MEIVAILSIVSAVMALVRTGVMGYVEIKGVLDKYAALPATPENIELMRLDLLQQAQVRQAVDDPRIQALLKADGIDPETLRVV